jgi:hypothetical protein
MCDVTINNLIKILEIYYHAISTYLKLNANMEVSKYVSCFSQCKWNIEKMLAS